MNLAALSLRRPVTVLMFFVSMVVIGLIAATRLPLEQFPGIDVPFLFVQVPYAGSTPEEIERTITRPVEEALATIPGVQRMTSQSRADEATVMMEFAWSQDVALTAIEARERLDGIRHELPEDLQRLHVLRFSTSDNPLVRLRIAAPGVDLSNAWAVLEREIKQPLERIPGVARVDLSGIGRPEVQIEVSADRLQAHGIALDQLHEALRRANFAISAGQLDAADMRWSILGDGRWSDVQDIRNVVLNPQGVRLADVAQVEVRPATLDYARRLDGRPAVGVDVFRERDANLVEVGKQVLARVEQMESSPALHGIQVGLIYNEADSVTSSQRALVHAGLLGTALALLVLFFFLRDWASTLMVSLAIPICTVMTLGLMHFLGLSLNVLSMMGLLLAVGMLVDNAVVVVESIYQYRERQPDQPWHAAIAGTGRVGLAIAAGTLTSIIVFLPNIFGGRTEISVILAHIAIPMSIAHLASWLVAVSLVPMLSSRLPAPRFIGRETMLSRMRSRYGKWVAWTLVHRRLTMAGVALLLIASLVPITQTKTDMFDSAQSRQLMLRWDLNANYRLAELETAMLRLERYLDENRDELEVASHYSWYNENGQASTQVTLREGAQAKRSTREIREAMRAGLPHMAVGRIGFDSSDAESDIDISLIGDSAAQLERLSQGVIPLMAGMESLRDVRVAERGGGHELSAHVDRIRAARQGLDANEVADWLAVAIRGMPLKDLRAGERELPVWLRLRDADSQGRHELAALSLRNARGEPVALDSVVQMQSRDAASAIERVNRQTALTIAASLAPGKTMADARAEITAAMGSVELPAGYGWSFGTGFARDSDAGAQMLFNTMVALLLVYMLMCAMFESMVFPVAIMVTFIFSILGVYWLFWLTGTTFSIMAAIGVLILMGVVVNNGIVMIVHINQLRDDGMTRSAALCTGASERLRPILMTMTTTILGMLPLALTATQAWSDGPAYYPMARALVGGLAFSTLLTLLALPCMYALLDDLRGWTGRVLRDGIDGRIRPRPRPPSARRFVRLSRRAGT